MNCPAKHTKPQIPDAEWRCPSCGIGVDHPSGGFVINDSDPDSIPECPQLHATDGLFCYSCSRGLSGKQFARRYAKVKSMVPCEHCKGTGLVKS